MAKGPSGRIIAEIEPERKRAFYAALAADGLTFKDWLKAKSEDYIERHRQPEFSNLVADLETHQSVAEDYAAYEKREERKAP